MNLFSILIDEENLHEKYMTILHDKTIKDFNRKIIQCWVKKKKAS